MVLLYPLPCHDEAHLSASQSSPDSHARLSRPHGDARGTQGLAESSAKGSPALGADDLQKVVSFRLGPDRRLRRHTEFVEEQGNSRRIGTPHFTLLVAAHAFPPRAPRLGLVVSRKTGNAVCRNRVRRLCRECFRLWPGLLPAGVDLIVVARHGAHLLGLGQVRAEWAAVELPLRKRAADTLANVGSKTHCGRS